MDAWRRVRDTAPPRPALPGLPAVTFAESSRVAEEMGLPRDSQGAWTMTRSLRQRWAVNRTPFKQLPLPRSSPLPFATCLGVSQTSCETADCLQRAPLLEREWLFEMFLPMRRGGSFASFTDTHRSTQRNLLIPEAKGGVSSGDGSFVAAEWDFSTHS